MNPIYLAALAVYPLLQGAWENGPLPPGFSSPPQASSHLENYAIEEQAAYYGTCADPALRSEIALALAKSSNPAALKTLERLVKKETNPATRLDLLNAALSLSDYGAVSDKEAFRSIMKTGSGDERTVAALILAKAGAPPDELIEFLASEKSLFAHNALWPLIGASAAKAKSEPLKKLLVSDFAPARAGAAGALVASGILKSDAKALEKLAQDKEASVRFALASALAKSDDGLELLKSLAKDANPSVRAAIATAKPAPGRESVLIELTGDPDASVRRTACESLALFKSEASEKALLAGLQDKDQFVRAAAEKSFGALKPEGGSLALAENLLSSGKAFERASAISALGLAGAKGSARGILEVLKSGPDADTAKRCVDALKLLDFKEAASAIAANANSKNDAVKISVAEALGALKGADGFDALIMLAKDKNPEVGRAALRSMGRIADMKFASSICALAADVKTEPARRAAACWAASKLPKLDAKCVAALNRLAVEPCIPEPMTNMKLYDSDDVRISALIALSEAAKRGDEKAKTAYASAMESFKGPFAKMPGKDGGQLLTNLLEDYVRQLELLRFGQTPAPQEIPSQEPELAVRKLK